MAKQEAVKSVLDGKLPQLSISFNNKTVPNGTHIPRAEAQSAPSIVWSSAPSAASTSQATPTDASTHTGTMGTDTGKKYIHVNIDLDAPFVGFPFLAPILHFLQKDVTVENASTSPLSSKVPPVVSWVAPGPPPGSGPHRYVSLLYEQPEGFNAKGEIIPEAGLSRTARMRFDFAAFEKKAGLGKPVAGGYFLSN